MEYLIDHANFKDTEIYFPNIGMVPLKRGDHVFGSRKLSEFLGIGRQVLRNKLKILKNIGFLTHRTTHHYTIVNICNYDKYNPSEKTENPQPHTTTTRTQPALNPHSTTDNNVNKDNKEKNDKYASNYPEDFERFWSIYPKKVGKGAAFNSWRKIKKGNGVFEQILSSVENHCKMDQWKRDNGQYIPHPATWLNQCRWQDECKIDDPWSRL